MITASANPARRWTYLSTTDTFGEVDGQLVDWTAIERVINGQPAHLEQHERDIALPMLHRRGLGPADIAPLFGVSERTVGRWLLDAGLTKPRQLSGCGTEGGYRTHRRRGEPVCAACQAAHTEANRRYYRTGTSKEAS